MFYEADDLIDYDRRTPYTFETIEIKNGIKYRIIYTVRKGIADSRIITYDIIKLEEKSE
jgi:hypothetical protein